jgi:hypothetical protein
MTLDPTATAARTPSSEANVMRNCPSAAAILAVVILSGTACAPAQPNSPDTGPTDSSPSTSVAVTSTASAAPAEVAGPAKIVVASGHGWTASGLEGPMPAPGTCHVRHAADEEPLPDPACTPGAVDAVVTDENVASTICRKGGYTTSVRPPESLTAPAKRALLAAYGIPAAQVSNYELDHLVELAAGGASDTRNLWPEPNTLTMYKGSAFVHNDKDNVEAYTFRAICAGNVTPTAVQQAMATDWTTAMSVLGLPSIPTA